MADDRGTGIGHAALASYLSRVLGARVAVLGMHRLGAEHGTEDSDHTRQALLGLARVSSMARPLRPPGRPSCSE